MKKSSIVTRLLCSFMMLCLLSVAQASSPVWTLTPLTATTIAVPSNDTAIVQYLVENQSTTPRTLTMQSIPGVVQLTTGLGVCGRSFILSGKASCTLSLEIDGSLLTRPIMDGPVVCENGSKFLCYRPARSNNLHITQAPLPDTSVIPESGAASGGTGVTLTGVDFTGATDVTFGGVAATSVHVVNSTTITAVTPAHAVGPVDVVITTPSGPVTYINGYTYETTAVGQPAYGGTIACLNGGDDDLIAAVANNSSGIQWGPSHTTNAKSLTDGAANTETIVDCLSKNTGCTNPLNPPINTDTYAAGICSTYQVDSQGNSPCAPGNACYGDWFLPATGQLECLYNNQEAIGGFSTSPTPYYWSSTEDVAEHAYVLYFFNGSFDLDDKPVPRQIRCVQAFTPTL
ncbi:MAG: IPT/TIG domain-containing protein [Legionellaceae bacterium]|nr:IPT/TIG domain-containing protein [Legionellaceae bacterium]